MTIEQLRVAWERRPFRGFEILLAGGERIAIGRPENIAWDGETRTAACLSGGAWNVIDIDLVTSLRIPATKGRGRGRKDDGA